MKKFFRDKAYKSIRNESDAEWPLWLRLLFIIGVLVFCGLAYWRVI